MCENYVVFTFPRAASWYFCNELNLLPHTTCTGEAFLEKQNQNVLQTRNVTATGFSELLRAHDNFCRGICKSYVMTHSEHHSACGHKVFPTMLFPGGKAPRLPLLLAQAQLAARGLDGGATRIIVLERMDKLKSRAD